MSGGVRSPKPEGRNPKEGRRPKSEEATRQSWNAAFSGNEPGRQGAKGGFYPSNWKAAVSFGLRISALGFPSAFGLRISDFGFCAWSHLQPIRRSGDNEVKRGHEKHADEKPCEQAADNDQRERPLGIGADTGSDRRRHKPQGGHQRRHHDRTQSQDRAVADGLTEFHATASQFVHI